MKMEIQDQAAPDGRNAQRSEHFSFTSGNFRILRLRHQSLGGCVLCAKTKTFLKFLSDERSGAIAPGAWAASPATCALSAREVCCSPRDPLQPPRRLALSPPGRCTACPGARCSLPGDLRSLRRGGALLTLGPAAASRRKELQRRLSAVGRDGHRWGSTHESFWL